MRTILTVGNESHKVLLKYYGLIKGISTMSCDCYIHISQIHFILKHDDLLFLNIILFKAIVLVILINKRK